MITILRLIIVIAMTILLIVQINYLIKEELDKNLLCCAIIQILNIIQLTLRCYE